MKCICCSTKMIRSKEFDIVLNGSEINISTRFGSKYDGFEFKGWICDKCISLKRKNKSIKFLRDKILNIKEKDINWNDYEMEI